MRRPAADGKRALGSAATIGAILAVLVFVRLPLLTKDASARGWNGDSAIFGLMAKRIHDGRGFDVFFWGQNYMGPLTPALAAGVRTVLLDPAGVGAEGGPIALRLASTAEIAVGISLSVVAFTRLFGSAVAALAGLWMAIGPPFFIRISAVSRSESGPEMAYVLGAALFLLGADALTRPRPFLDRAPGRFVLGLLAGVGWWMHPAVVFVLLPVAVLAFLRAAPRSLGEAARFAIPLVAGAALGYLPVWLGGLLGWYEPGRSAFVAPWQLSALPARAYRFLGSDAWRFVGLDGLAPVPVLAAAALVPLSLLFRRARRLAVQLRAREGFHVEGIDLAALVVVCGAAVSFLKDFEPRGDRYLAPVLPAALAFLLVSFAEAADPLRRRIPSVCVTLALGGLALAATLLLGRQARAAVAALEREPDPRAPLAKIAEGGYTVCHAGYDTAYTLQFLSDERVRFIPYHSPDRNRAQSAALRALPGPQCLVAGDGSVRAWLPSDAAAEGSPARLRAERR